MKNFNTSISLKSVAILSVLLVGGSVYSPAVAAASSSGASSSSSGVSMRELKEFLLHYDGDYSKASQEFIDTLLSKLPMTYRWAKQCVLREAPDNAINKLAFNADGSKLASVDSNCVICVWNVLTGELVASSELDEGRLLNIINIDFALDDTTLIVVSYQTRHPTEEDSIEPWHIDGSHIVRGAPSDWEFIRSTTATNHIFRNTGTQQEVLYTKNPLSVKRPFSKDYESLLRFNLELDELDAKPYAAVFSSNNFLAIGCSHGLIMLCAPLSTKQQLLIFKALKNPVLENSAQREALQELAYSLPEKHQEMVLNGIPLLKKEYDGTEFACDFLTEPVLVRSHDKTVTIELAPQELQRLLPAVLLRQQSMLEIMGKKTDKEPFIFEFTDNFDASTVSSLHDTKKHLAAQELFNLLRTYDYLCCQGYTKEYRIDTLTTLFIHRCALDKFGLNLSLPSILQSAIDCWPISATSTDAFDFQKQLEPVIYCQDIYFSPHGRYLMEILDLFGHDNNKKELHIWDLHQNPMHCQVRTIKSENYDVGVAWSCDNEEEFTTWSGKQCGIVQNGENIDFKFPNIIHDLYYLNATTIAGFSYEAQQIYLLDIATQRITQTISIAGLRAQCMALSPDKAVLAIGATNGTINLVNPNSLTLEHLRPPLVFDTAPIITLGFSPDGSLLASYANDGTLRVYEIATGTLKKTFHQPREIFENSVRLTISTDNRYVLFKKRSNSIAFDIASGKEIVVPGKKGAFDPAGIWYASCDDHGYFSVSFYLPHKLTAEQYLLLEKAWSNPGLFSEYLTPEERAEIKSEQLSHLEWQQKDCLAAIYRRLPENLQRFVLARMPWIGA